MARGTRARSTWVVVGLSVLAAAVSLPVFLGGLWWLSRFPLGRVALVERPEAFRELSGTLLFAREGHALRARELRSGLERVLELDGRIERVSGPARDGSYAALVVAEDGTRLVLASVRDAGSRVVRRFARRPREPGSVCGLALSPDGRGLAFALEPARARGPYGAVHEPLHLLALESGEETFIEDVGGACCWSPDGERIFFVRHLRPDQLPADAIPPALRTWMSRWQEPFVPAVVEHELRGGAERRVTLGWSPLLSSGGRTLLVERGLGGCVAHELASGVERELDCPGRKGPLLALVDERFLLYSALPTAGAPARWQWNAFPGPAELPCLKALAVGSGAVATLVQGLSFPPAPSFGIVEPAGRSEDER